MGCAESVTRRAPHAGAAPTIAPTRAASSDDAPHEGVIVAARTYDSSHGNATEEGRETDSGIEVKPVYTADDVEKELELPGEYPFTRGPNPDMYRGRPWTIRQYAGFGSAEETNERFRYLLERGQTGL